jgi:hypothetical protein
MRNLTPKKLQKYAMDYDYEIDLEQAREILELLDDRVGIFSSEDIEMATDYIINGQNSRYADYF